MIDISKRNGEEMQHEMVLQYIRKKVEKEREKVDEIDPKLKLIE